VTDETRKAMLDEVIAWSDVPKPIEENEFSVSEYATRVDLKPQAAKRLLDKLIKEGKLSKRQVRTSNGRCLTAYRIIEKT